MKPIHLIHYMLSIILVMACDDTLDLDPERVEDLGVSPTHTSNPSISDITLDLTDTEDVFVSDESDIPLLDQRDDDLSNTFSDSFEDLTEIPDSQPDEPPPSEDISSDSSHQDLVSDDDTQVPSDSDSPADIDNDINDVIQSPVCGDRVVTPPEECDDGNAVPEDDCNACQLPFCGDGFLQTGEECDDGNGLLNDACPDGPSGTCQDATCGDGFIRTGYEQCDGASVGGVPCSQCQLACQGSFEDCNGLVDDLCETDLLITAKHCGNCNNPCANECSNGQCFFDCNGLPDDGPETDLSNDSNNCRTCGHSCQGAPCIGGYCQPFLMSLSEADADWIYDLGTSYNNNFYYVREWWFGSLSIMRMPDDAVCSFGEFIQYACSRLYMKFNEIDSNDSRLYVLSGPCSVNDYQRLVSYQNTGEGAYELWMETPPTHVDFVVDETYIYWTNAAQQSLFRINKVTYETELLAADLSNPQALAQDSTHLYVMDRDDLQNYGLLLKISKTGGSPEILAITSGHGPIYVRNSKIFWMNHSLPSPLQSIPEEGWRTILTVVSVEGGSAVTLKTIFPSISLLFYMDDTHIYWFGRHRLRSTAFFRVNLDGQNEEIIASQDSMKQVVYGFPLCAISPSNTMSPCAGFGGFILDDQFIYWLCNGKIFRIAK